MPTRAKKTVEKEEKINVGTSSKKAKKVTKEADIEPKKATAKVAAKKTSTTKTKADTKKKSTASKAATSKTTKKSKGKTVSSASKKKATSTKRKSQNSSKKVTKPEAVPALEYYDLPFRYNETLVKVLAQTPKSLFVYWDISDNDRANLVKTFGENFFNDTIPFLRITNENNGYSFDVDIDDFANGWYVHIPDAKCTYSISLLRKQRPFRNKIVEHEVYVTSSNKIEAPNDHILFEKASPTVVYKNVKTNSISVKTLPENIYRKSRNSIYGLYEYYKDIYQCEDLDNVFNLNNPSSGNPTSTFK